MKGLKIELLTNPLDTVLDLLLEADPSRGMVDDYLARGNCYAAWLGEIIAGEIVLLKTRPGIMEVVNLAVRKEFRRRGIAGELLRFAREETLRTGCRTLEIGTGNPGAAQMLLYQKQGFRITGVDFDFFRRHYSGRIYENGLECRDMIRMSLFLPDPRTRKPALEEETYKTAGAASADASGLSAPSGIIRPVVPQDAGALCDIYNYYVKNTVISFDEKQLRRKEMEERIKIVSSKYPFLVWELEGKPAGYINANTWKERAAYRHAAEASIYLRPDLLGQGIGGRLMEAFLAEVRKTDIHTLISGIALPNPGSVALHEKFGFRRIGCFPEVGYKLGIRLDVGYWVLHPGRTEP